MGASHVRLGTRQSGISGHQNRAGVLYILAQFSSIGPTAYRSESTHCDIWLSDFRLSGRARMKTGDRSSSSNSRLNRGQSRVFPGPGFQVSYFYTPGSDEHGPRF